eukprot:877210-Rhodomonas_salina.1
MAYLDRSGYRDLIWLHAQTLSLVARGWYRVVSGYSAWQLVARRRYLVLSGYRGSEDEVNGCSVLPPSHLTSVHNTLAPCPSSMP